MNETTPVNDGAEVDMTDFDYEPPIELVESVAGRAADDEVGHYADNSDDEGAGDGADAH